MKFYLFCIGLLLLFLPLTTYAQTSEQTITFESAIEKDGVVEVTLASDTKFIVGANRYVLHGGGSYFARSIHPDGDEFKIKFFIPSEQFAGINGLNNLVLVYGLYETNKRQDGEGDQSNGFEGSHWKVNGTITLNQ